LVTEIRAGQAPTPEEVAPKAAVFREEESRPLPVMARASKKEQEVGRVMAMQVIQDRLEVEAHQEEKTDPLTDHMVNLLKKEQDLFQNQIIQGNPIANQAQDLIVDAMKGLQVVHQIVPLAGRRDHQETDPIVDAMKDLHRNQEIVHTKELKEVQAIQQKDPIVVVQKDLLQNQEIVHTKEPKEVQAIQQKDPFVVVQRDLLQNQEIVHTKKQKDPIVVTQRDHLQNQVIVLSEEQRGHHLMPTKAKYAVRMTDLKGIHRNVHLAELKSPLESQMKDQPAVGQKDHHQNRVIVHTKDRKHHFVTRITNLVAAG
jgi:hypothetical protein